DPILPAPPPGPGRLCVNAGQGPRLHIGGFAGLPTNGLHPTINGRPIAASIDLWFLPPHAEKRSLIANWAAMMHRLSRFRPGFAGAAFYCLLSLIGLLLLSYSALR